jgi:chemotaxis protein MotB
MARGRKTPDEEGSSYSWMDTYGDLVTLLLCFFVLLYAFSSIDAEKWQELVGAFTGRNAVSVEQLDMQTARENPIVIEGAEKTEEEEPAETEQITNVDDDYAAEFDALYAAIQYYISTNGLEKKISVTKDNNVIVVRFTEVILFNSGEADILDEGKAILSHIISIIKENVEAIQMLRIEGHTDNVPIGMAHYESNWELSMARANAALKVFIESGVIDFDKLSAAAYGEYQPVASNDTPEGRAANRRVDFVIEKIETDAG